jgi:hypothetical protein
VAGEVAEGFVFDDVLSDAAAAGGDVDAAEMVGVVDGQNPVLKAGGVNTAGDRRVNVRELTCRQVET